MKAAEVIDWSTVKLNRYVYGQGGRNRETLGTLCLGTIAQSIDLIMEKKWGKKKKVGRKWKNQKDK